MAIANVNLTDTFQNWVTKTNQLINYTDQVNTQLQVISVTANNLPPNVRWTANAVNNIISGAQILTNTTLAGANVITIKYDATTVNTSAAPSLRFQTRRANSVIFVQQVDDNFVMYTTNTANMTVRPVWSVLANSNNTPLRTNIPLSPDSGIKGKTSSGYGSETFGNTGDILVSGGGGLLGSLNHAPSGSFGSYVTWQTQPTMSVKHFGAVGDGVTNDRVAIQNAIDTANTNGSNVYFPAGTYSIDASIDMRNRFVKLIGDGPTRTVIVPSLAVHSIIDVNQASFYPSSITSQLANNTDIPFSIEGIGFDGNFDGSTYKANNGIVVSFRQNFSLKNINVRACNNGITEASTTSGYHENITIQNCGKVGFNLGDRNQAYRSATTWNEFKNEAPVKSSVFNSCKVTGIIPLGVAAYSSPGIKFNGLEISELRPSSGATPYAANLYSSFTFNLPLGTGIYSDWGWCSIENSSLGANCTGPSVLTADGTVTIDKSTILYGYSSNNVVYYSFYGNMRVQNSLIVPNLPFANNFSTYRYVARRDTSAIAQNHTLGGKVTFQNCRVGSNAQHANANSYVMVGDVLDRGPPGVSYVPRYGRNYTMQVYSGSGSISQTLGLTEATYNMKTFTVTSGGISTATIYAPLSLASANVASMSRGEMMGLFVVYSSNFPVRARLTEAIGGATGKYLPSASDELTLTRSYLMPSTNGLMSTYIKTNISAYSSQVDDLGAFKFFEFIMDNPNVGSTITILEVALVDNRFLNAGQAYPSNPGAGSDIHYLYKP